VTARQQIRRVRDALLRLVTKAGWPAIAASLLLLYAFGAVLMPLLEGADSPLASLPGYSWWFIVTATTVGYGDIAPSTFGGRAVAVVIMLLGVGVIAVTVAKIAEEVVDFGRRRMRGLTQLNEKGHLVILGYCSGETGTLIQELLRDESEARTSIVLCSSVLEENPMPDKVRFVRGELSSEDVLQRACVREAERILVHCDDENETLVAALAARSVNRSAHMVARFQKPDSELHLKRIDPNIECVPPLSVPLMVHSIQDHGTTAVISSLLSHATDDTIFRIQVPKTGKGRAFGILHRAFKEKLGACLLAMAGPDGLSDLDLNPDSEKSVDAGDCLFYIAPRRILEDQIPWNDL